MNFKLIVTALFIVLSLTCYASDIPANGPPVNTNEIAMNLPKFSQFNPNDEYSYEVYNRGAIVTYKGKTYQAVRTIDNNQVPGKSGFWKVVD